MCRFKYRNDEPNWISIQSQDDRNYCKGLGFQGKKGTKKQKVNLAQSAFRIKEGKRKAIGTPIHELMHAIGTLKIVYINDKR